MRDGSALVVEIGGKTLTHVHESGDTSVVAALGGGPNGAALGPAPWVYVCNSGGWEHAEYAPGLMRTVGQSDTPGWIERVNLNTGAVERLYEAADGERLQAPNDLVFDAWGGFYFTDHGKRLHGRLGLGAVYYAAADGGAIRLVVRGMITPNGVGLSPDGGVLYVAETATRCLWAFDLQAPGMIAPQSFPPSSNGGRLVAGLAGYSRPDSLAIDSAGHIAVASLITGCVWDIAPDGASARQYLTDDVFTTNIAFGGDDLRTAYVTLSASGRLARFSWTRPGQPLQHQDRL